MAKLRTIKPLVSTMPRRIATQRDLRDKIVDWRAWYKTSRWQDIRFRTLTAAGFKCQRCGWQDANMARLCGLLSQVEKWDRQFLKAPLLVADHITPHRGDPAMFWYEANIQCLCKPCHDGVKQKEERSGQALRFGYSVPHGTLPSSVPVTLVCGPPAAGKTTWIRSRASEDDLVIDFDVYRARVGGIKWDDNPGIMAMAYAMRDADIHSLSARYKGRAWLIAMAPTRAERHEWRKALGPLCEIVMLATPADVCLARIAGDPTRTPAAEKMRAAVAKWWAEYEA